MMAWQDAETLNLHMAGVTGSGRHDNVQFFHSYNLKMFSTASDTN